MTFQNIMTHIQNRVGVITLHRPEHLNVLSAALAKELSTALNTMDNDPNIRVMVLTGGDKVFSAGGDIKEMAPKSFHDVYHEDFIHAWESAARCRKPLIAAVAGYALGGGCELAMMCDFIVAADTARFGQPEITIGTLPGAGGTQRLTRLIGKAKAMDMCLTGRRIDAIEAERIGLVARVFPAATLMQETLKIAETIAGYSQMAAMMTKEAVNRADETTLSEGLRFERRLFQASFSTPDRMEGMQAFLEKRPPQFKD